MTDYVIAETIDAHAWATRTSPALCAFGEWLLHSATRAAGSRWTSICGMRPGDLFKTYDDKEFSFVDCASFVVMRREHLVDAFTFDHHFAQMGFRLWPGGK